ncbi:hypothetical protein ACLBXM_05500 [Xanthobacteraceae bacterium A53D]
MSLQPVTPVDSASLHYAARQSREAAEAMAAAVVAGDMAAAQRYLAIMQIQDVNLPASARSTTIASTDAAGGGERRTGLGALIAAVQSGSMPRALSAIGKGPESPEEMKAAALAAQAEMVGISAPKVIDSSNAGAVLLDLSSRIETEMNGTRRDPSPRAEARSEDRDTSDRTAETAALPELPNTFDVPGPGEERNGNTRYSAEDVRSRAQVLHSYSQYLAF